MYGVFVHGFNILQIVNILPHGRYDQFKEKCVDKFQEMSRCIAHKACPAEQCMWPFLHKDTETLKGSGKYRGIKLISSLPS